MNYMPVTDIPDLPAAPITNGPPTVDPPSIISDPNQMTLSPRLELLPPTIQVKYCTTYSEMHLMGTFWVSRNATSKGKLHFW